MFHLYARNASSRHMLAEHLLHISRVFFHMLPQCVCFLPVRTHCGNIAGTLRAHFLKMFTSSLLLLFAFEKIGNASPQIVKRMQIHFVLPAVNKYYLLLQFLSNTLPPHLGTWKLISNPKRTALSWPI